MLDRLDEIPDHGPFNVLCRRFAQTRSRIRLLLSRARRESLGANLPEVFSACLPGAVPPCLAIRAHAGDDPTS